MKRASTLLAALAILVAGCVRSPSGAPDDLARLVPLGGQLTVVRGGETIVATEELTLVAGDLVTTSEGATARLILPGEQSLELAPETTVQMQPGPAPRLLEGDLLGLAGDGLVVLAGDDRLLARDTVFRVQRQFSTAVEVYQGRVDVPDLEQFVPRLRRLTVAAGGNLPQGLEPLVVDPNDPWDKRYLGRAIDMGLGIDRLKKGLAPQLAGRRGTDAVSDLLSEDYARSLVRSLLGQVERSELADVVVAGALAPQAAAQADDPASTLFERMLDLRLGDGAQWIVIVAEWQLFSERLLNSLADSLTGIIARAAAPTPGEGGTGPAAGAGGSPSGQPGSGPGPGEPGPANDDNNGGRNNDDPSPPPPPPPPPECENAVECVVEDLLDTTDAL